MKKRAPAIAPSLEPELAGPPPRTARWFTLEGTRHPAQARLRTLHAARATLVRVKETQDSEGPTFTIDLTYRCCGRTRKARIVDSFDMYGWTISPGGHIGWYDRTIRTGGTATVLVGPRHDRPRLYGNLRAYVKVDDELVWAADREAALPRGHDRREPRAGRLDDARPRLASRSRGETSARRR